MGKIAGICISEKRGIAKSPIEKAHLIEEFGIEGDAHAGSWHRQVSLLGKGEVDAFKALGAKVELGSFGENILVDGYCMKEHPVGSKFVCGNVIFEITQIGKECHSHCTIYQTMGDCIMPREGVFARVLAGGDICVGDEIHLIEE